MGYFTATLLDDLWSLSNLLAMLLRGVHMHCFIQKHGKFGNSRPLSVSVYEEVAVWRWAGRLKPRVGIFLVTQASQFTLQENGRNARSGLRSLHEKFYCLHNKRAQPKYKFSVFPKAHSFPVQPPSYWRWFSPVTEIFFPIKSNRLVRSFLRDGRTFRMRPFG